jgi:hypothetical protein
MTGYSYPTTLHRRHLAAGRNTMAIDVAVRKIIIPASSTIRIPPRRSVSDHPQPPPPSST